MKRLFKKTTSAVPCGTCGKTCSTRDRGLLEKTAFCRECSQHASLTDAEAQLKIRAHRELWDKSELPQFKLYAEKRIKLWAGEWETIAAKKAALVRGGHTRKETEIWVQEKAVRWGKEFEGAAQINRRYLGKAGKAGKIVEFCQLWKELEEKCRLDPAWKLEWGSPGYGAGELWRILGAGVFISWRVR